MSIASSYQSCRHRVSYMSGLPMRYDPRISNRLVVPVAILTKVAEQYQVARSKDRSISRLSSLCKAMGEYKIGNYETALVLAWFIIEEIIIQKWTKHIEAKNLVFPDESKKINAEMRKKFMGRDYPVSVVSSILLLEDVIAKDDFEAIDDVRGYRNDIVHRKPGFECGLDESKKALELSAKMLTELYSIPLKLNLSLSVPGL